MKLFHGRARVTFAGGRSCCNKANGTWPLNPESTGVIPSSRTLAKMRLASCRRAVRQCAGDARPGRALPFCLLFFVGPFFCSWERRLQVSRPRSRRSRGRRSHPTPRCRRAAPVAAARNRSSARAARLRRLREADRIRRAAARRRRREARRCGRRAVPPPARSVECGASALRQPHREFRL